MCENVGVSARACVRACIRIVGMFTFSYKTTIRDKATTIQAKTNPFFSNLSPVVTS